MSKPNVLIVLSSHSAGWYLPEFAHPYEVLSPHCNLTIASPLGGPTVLDPVSIELFKGDAYCLEFSKTQSKLWLETEKLDAFIGKEKDFDAVLVVGGFGPMFDLATSPTSQALLAAFFDAGKIVSAVCHGSAALLHVTLADGTPLIANMAVTGFSNAEEIAVDRQKDMPFHLETALDVASGGNYVKAGEAWAPRVTVGKEGEKGSRGMRLLTGQNPASAQGVAERLLVLLGVK